MTVVLRFCLIAASLFLLTSCDKTEASETADTSLTTNVELMTYFEEAYPDKELVLLLEGDCNADGISDLVIAYTENANENHMVTVYSKEDGFELTEPIHAPYEDCAMEWKDIDESPPVELIVSGRRGINMGYGILRFLDGEWIDLFGGMEDCC